jgi:endonuclease III
VVNILRHIVLACGRKIPHDFLTWINFYEIGPKTASLLLWSAFHIRSTLPVDSHVWHAFNKWNYTNAKTEDECSWQAEHWMPASSFIPTNDVIGSIRQGLHRANSSVRQRIIQLHAKNHYPKSVSEKVDLLAAK